MRNPLLTSEIDRALVALQSARTAAALGDTIAAEEALVDAYNHLSKLLRNVEVHERGKMRAGVAMWRSHPAA